jgi:hypothetical protein
MKKIIIIILLFMAYSVSVNAQISTACCPEFVLKFKRDADCLKTGPCAGNVANGESNFTASMCKYSTNTFLVTPNLPGYTYAWTVTGGVFTPSGLTTSTTNPSTITWGGGGTGTITVTITSADGKCIKTIKETVCLRDAPKALFTFTPNNACVGTLINFSNASVGGAAVSWDFGDGTFAGNVSNPTHSYSTPGTYNVTITVYSDTADCRPSTQSPPGDGQPPRACCGCISTYTLPVIVIAGNPLSIVPKDCINQCLCPGDTAEYCASKICAPYNWTVTGGTIISGAGTSCIKVVWGNTYPTKIQLVQPGCGNPCNDTSRLNVPVLVSGIPIMPNFTTVCQNSVQNYSLPAMPGAFYNWIVTGGIIVGPNQNTSSITVNWGAGPTGQVNCTYNNPLKPGCDGSTSLSVSIKPILKINGPTQTCEGCGITLFTGGLPVTWTGPAGVTFTPGVGSATLVNFPITGVMSTYTITATSGAFCNSPQTHTVVVAPKPVLSISPSTVQTCPNTPIKFVATSSVSTGNINWVLPVGASMIANTGPQLDTAVIQFATLPATVTAEQLCAFNLVCSKGTATATVTKPPVPIIAPSITNPCIDQTVTYTVSNAVPGVVYTWAISSTLGTITSGQGTSSVQILWHGGSPNTATLTVSNCAGPSIAVPITVTLPVFPTITVGGTCIKTGMTLTSSTGGPYLWSGPGVTGQTTATVNINQPGTYTVTINAGGAGSCAQTKSITIPPNPYWVKIIPPCSVASCNINSLSVLLTVATNIGSPTNCQWWFDPVGAPPPYIISTSCGNYTATALGSYYLVMTDANGCKDTSNIIRIPQDINICCTTPACSALSGVNFNFTHSGCQPTAFTGSPLVLPSGWTIGTLHPTICYGDGTSDDFVSLNTTHQYAAAGVYTVCVVQKVVKISTNDTCCITTCKQVTIPVVTKFTASFNCNTGLLTMNDGSSYYPSSAGANYSWTVTGGTYTGTLTNAPNQTITPTSSGTFNITLSITLNGCTSTYNVSVPVVLPVAPITATPNPSCDGSPVFFSTTPGMSCYWQFGDGKFSYAATPQHIYAGPGSYTVTLTATTPDGCVITTTKVVVIQPKPIVTLTPKNSTVCPGSSVTLTASINANGNTMCPTLASYTFQWYKDGVAYGAPTNSSTLTTTQYGNYYAVLTSTSAGCNCVITTDTAQIKWFPKPIAKIKGKSAICLVGGVGTVNLSNSVGTYPTYNWSSNNPGGISFSPLNLPTTTATITTPGNFQIFLEVIDANGCKAYDTLCIYATNSPTAFINPPGGALCAGNVYSLTATPTPATAPPAGYNYLWNNNASTQTINASAAGVYYAFVTDMNTGCSAQTNAITINKGPDLSLFPSCCDTICSDKPINISVPLPLAPGENICTKYTIVWLDNNVPISPQPSPCNILNTANLVPLLGMHNISIAVTLNGCTDTSNVFNLYIKDCGCDCKGSHWGDIILSEGEKKVKEGNPKEVKNNPGKMVVDGKPLECKQTYNLKCNQPFTINANYICKDTTCPSKVTYVLTPPTGPVVTGNAPLTYTPTVSGTYTLMLYGWCNGIKCDSCLITFKVECKDPPKDCCKGSKWGEKTVTIGNNTQPFTCFKDYGKIKCKTPITVNANYICADASCPGTVTYSYTQPSGTTTGTLPATFTPTQNGWHWISIIGYCGGVPCDTCTIRFMVEGCDTTSCCPYEIKVTPKEVTYTSNPTSTIVSNNFSISIPATANITEVRANVISYTIDDNFKGDCMKCVNLPFTWASTSTATNIATAPPKITMFGGATVPSFNGSGAGAYQNPREIVWNNGSNLNSPNITNIGMSFILPPTPNIDCCELKGKICVKFIFRNDKCEECEAIACFDFLIKKK